MLILSVRYRTVISEDNGFQENFLSRPAVQNGRSFLRPCPASKTRATASACRRAALTLRTIRPDVFVSAVVRHTHRAGRPSHYACFKLAHIPTHTYFPDFP